MAFELPESFTIAKQMDKELKVKKIERAWMDEKECATFTKRRWG